LKEGRSMGIEWSAKQAGLIMAPFDHTLDWNEGTPRSGKTTAGTMRFARHLIKSRDALHLVVAYSAEQAFRLIMDGDGMGLLHIFAGCCRTSHDDSGAHLLIHLPSGDKKVYWKGGGKADSYKAITGMSLGSVYFCEINLLHDSMIQECFRRTYAAKDRWHIADLNPPSPADPVIKNVLEIQDSRFLHWTCADNPVLTPERLKEIETACGLAFTDIVNNANLGPETTAETVLSAVSYMEELSKLSGLPIFAHTAESLVAEQLNGKLSPVIPLQLQEKYFDLPSQKPGNRPLWG
jgi:hypothetical protein